MPPKFRHNNRKGLLWTPPVPARFRRRNRGIAPSSTSSGASTQQTQSPGSGGASDSYDDDYSIDPIVCESVLRRDGGKCVLCGIDDSMEDNRLETILVAWNNQAVGSHTAMKNWLHNTRSISVNFEPTDSMNLMTLCNACAYHYETSSWKLVPSPSDIESMIRSDLQDQQACVAAARCGQPRPQRVWPRLTQMFEVICTSAAECDVVYYARTTDEPIPVPVRPASASEGAGVERVDYEYRRFKLNINPYLALASAMELGPGKGYVDERTSRMHALIATAVKTFNARLPTQYRVNV